MTRLLSRVGRGPWTGIDRVEAAYLEKFCALGPPLMGLARTPDGFLLLSCETLRWLQSELSQMQAEGNRVGPETAAYRLHDRLVRRSVAQTSKWRPEPIFRALPENTHYFNVGHANLSRRVLRSLRGASGSSISVFLHDTIPLDFPQFQTRKAHRSARRRIALLSRFADRLVYPSRASRDAAERHLVSNGRVPTATVAPLGTSVSAVADLMPPRSHPYFICLGTVEPRKNIAFLLDLWEHLSHAKSLDPIPDLVIVGRTGWLSDGVIDRMRGLRSRGLPIEHLEYLDDASVSRLLAGARALLQPSLAEGFGLPPVEALSVGTPVICNDLPVFHEVLGSWASCRNVSDVQAWLDRITELADAEPPIRVAAKGLPTWDEHFNAVLSHCA